MHALETISFTVPSTAGKEGKIQKKKIVARVKTNMTTSFMLFSNQINFKRVFVISCMF